MVFVVIQKIEKYENLALSKSVKIFSSHNYY